MTYGLNTYSNISAFVNTIFEDALLVARDNALAPALVKTYFDQTSMAARVISQWGTASYTALAETDDLTSQVFSPSTLGTLTPGEYGAQYLLTDQRLASDPFGVQADASMELGAKYAEDVDTAVFANFTSLTGGTVGASGSTMTWAYLNAAIARLRNGKVPMAGLVAVLHPYHWNDLASSASVAGTSTNSPEWLRAEIATNFFVARASGVNIFVSPLAPTSSTDAYSAIFHPMALALDVRRGFRIEPDRDPSRRGLELNATGIYATGTNRPLWGVQILADATAP